MAIELRDATGTVIPVTFMQFSGGERHVQLTADDVTALNGNVYVRAQMLCSNDVMDYLLLENVLLAQGLTVYLEVPYFPYARQDRACAVGQAFSLDIMTRLLAINANQTQGSQAEIVVWDCHSSVTTALLNANSGFQAMRNIGSVEIIRQCAVLTDILSTEDCVLICPDKGAKARTESIAAGFADLRSSPLPIIYCDKQRDPSTGKILRAKVNASDLSGKTCVLTDDICDGGATFVGIAEALRELNCEHVVLYVTHGIFSKGLGVFAGLIDQIFTSDSLPQGVQADSDLLTVIPFNGTTIETSTPVNAQSGEQS